VIALRVDRVPVGPNSTFRGGRRVPGLLRSHWAARKRDLDDWTLEIRAAAGGIGCARPLARKLVVIVLHRRRMLDPDNAYGSLKPVLDGLRRNELIADDSTARIELVMRQVVGQLEHTEIAIMDLEG